MPESFAVKNLMENCLMRNLALFNSLKDDQWQEELHKATLADAALGRMRPPQLATEVVEELSAIIFHPRFGVEQGVRPDGTTKVRPVDHFSWSNVPRGSRAEKRHRA